MSPKLAIRQRPSADGQYLIDLRLERPGEAPIEGSASITFQLTPQEQQDLRWYMEDYPQHPEAVEAAHIDQIEAMMRARGGELYDKVLAANRNTQAIWFAIRNELADLRIEINTGIAEAAAIPWELMRDPESNSALAVRVQAFVRVQSNPNIGFVKVPQAHEGRIRLLYVACRPGGTRDVALRAVANRLLKGLEQAGKRRHFDIAVLRPPTYEQLQKTLAEAKRAGQPFHIVHFDGHGTYTDLSQTRYAAWLNRLGAFKYEGKIDGKRGYLLFEQPKDDDGIQPVSGEELGKLLHDHGVPVLVLNACQSAMHDAAEAPADADSVHDEVRAIGSLAQAVVDQGIPAVLGMRYSVFVVTAAQYIGELYAALAQGQSFGEAATLARRHLRDNPDRWAGFGLLRPLADWLVPVVYEAMRLTLPQTTAPGLGGQVESDPILSDDRLRLRYPEQGFIGRDETLLLLDRAFDKHPVVLLHAYAGQGKTSAAVEFARWYTQTGGLTRVLLTSFEIHVDLEDALNQLAHHFKDVLEAHGIEWHAVKPGERRPMALELLRRYPLLWIWDNVEPVAGFPAGSESAWTGAEQAELADFLRQLRQDQSTQVKLLLTSRRDERAWLGDISHRVSMPRMSRADSAALASELGRERGWKSSDIDGWGPLLDYCTGNPLALRVLAKQAIRLGLRGQEPVAKFIQAVRDGEQEIEDADEAEGRGYSLGASLAYGFRNAFTEEEMPVIALLSLFQGVVPVEIFSYMDMGQSRYILPELQNQDQDKIINILNRACEVGLLTSISGSWYGIHPAFPWFLKQAFKQYYDGTPGRSNSETALRAWVQGTNFAGSYYNEEFHHGNRQQATQFLGLVENNLLHARHLARRLGWWHIVTSGMQGLNVLYEYQGRLAEWAHLVAQVVPEYCSDDDEPLAGREEFYGLILSYRINLARYYDRDLDYAAALQNKQLKCARQEAAAVLSLPETTPLNTYQKALIRNLAASIFTLGCILLEQNDVECVVVYQEAICYYQRIADTTAEAIIYLNIGHAYRVISAIRNWDMAETAYQRGLELHNPSDAVGRSASLYQIGTIHHERFKETSLRSEREEITLRHAQVAEQYYHEALQLCPTDSVNNLGPIHNSLGILYGQLRRMEACREHLEQAVQFHVQVNEHYSAGQTRRNMAFMYESAAKRDPIHRHDLLLRARSYAEAALRDFQRYQGRAAADETQTQRFIADIDQALAG
ncbi:CHAT domain-containing protein [Methylomagnum ishizawai]|uniref:CHAT domain-containing protein n=1 Tax=Methylomagnum ishizawai TaxID=1760988 RepID=A0A1Y6D0F5_9GAMM|nr:CHAT domain-containing protein [Methylomagnum ishizawai]SMF96056.1 CHAT domain-containing protein [Methylomagnum ishizawai]